MKAIENRHAMPLQDAKKRIKNFDEVALGYDEKTAIEEAKRCLSCKNRPCVSACPVNVQIPSFIQKLKEAKFEEAYDIITSSSALPAICGRVCPQERQCEGKCTLGIKGESVAIGRLERFVADYHRSKKNKKLPKVVKNNIKVAIIGSGPSGLSCAGELVKHGFDVTIFEALHSAGGVLVYGIPEFRLPKSIVEDEINTLKEYGVKINLNTVIGRTLSIDDLFRDGFKAVFIGSGAGLPNFMNIKGENLNGVFSANEFLTRINLMKAYKSDADTPVMNMKKVAVVGGGNVAMDAARVALRLNTEKVYILYRRTISELPARREELEHAIEEGVELMELVKPVEILSFDEESGKKNFVRAVRCVRMELTDVDSKGRRGVREIPNSEFEIDIDALIMAIGTSPNPLIKRTTPSLEINERGGIIVNEDGLTSREGIYAGGDAVTGAASVISAAGAGKNAAESIASYFLKK